MSLVNLRLVSFRLVASQVGEEAWEGYWYQRSRTIRPLKLTEEILLKTCIGLTIIDAGSLIYLSSYECIVQADPGVTLVESLQLEELRWAGAGDVVIDVDIQDCASAIVTHGNQRL